MANQNMAEQAARHLDAEPGAAAVARHAPTGLGGRSEGDYRPARAPHASLSAQATGGDPALLLGPAMLAAVRLVVREELQARQPEEEEIRRDALISPPRASRATGIPAKTIRQWIRDELLPRRLKNSRTSHKQPKYVVLIDEVLRVSEQTAVGKQSGSAEFARARALEILGARTAKEG